MPCRRLLARARRLSAHHRNPTRGPLRLPGLTLTTTESFMPRKATVRTRALRKCGMVAAARAFVESLAVGAGQHAGHGEYDGICSCTGISLRFIRLINRLPFARRLNPDPRHGAHGRSAPRYQTVVDMSSPTGYAGRSTRSARCSSSIRRSAASMGCADARSRPNRLSTTTTAPSRSSAVST